MNNISQNRFIDIHMYDQSKYKGCSLLILIVLVTVAVSISTVYVSTVSIAHALNKNSNTTTDCSIPRTGFICYKSHNLGIALLVPAVWKVIENNYTKELNLFSPSVSVRSHWENPVSLLAISSSVDLDQYIRTEINYYKINLPDFRIVQSEFQNKLANITFTYKDMSGAKAKQTNY